MDQPKYQPSRADILTFPQMSRKEEQLLQTVLNNMSQGVLMFDSETRLIFCNQRYIELYGLSPEIVKPGCSLRDLLKHRIERGSFTGDPDEYVARLADGIAEGKTFNNIVDLPDGRAFSVVNKPVAGGGWLATHEDVTERQRVTVTKPPVSLIFQQTRWPGVPHGVPPGSRGRWCVCCAVRCRGHKNGTQEADRMPRDGAIILRG